MREKLLDLMKSEGLKPSQLAELLEINPAGISHILAGRNKPGFDLLQKILRRFPRINPDWLLLDSNKMYRDESALSETAASAPAKSPAIVEGLFGANENTSSSRQELTASANSDTSASISPSLLPGSRTDENLQRVVLFYDDGTFESFTPTKR